MRKFIKITNHLAQVVYQNPLSIDAFFEARPEDDPKFPSKAKPAKTAMTFRDLPDNVGYFMETPEEIAAMLEDALRHVSFVEELLS